MFRRALVGSVCLLVIACAGGPMPGPSVGADRPPDLVVSSEDSELVLRAYSYCWSGGSAGIQMVCADGTPLEPLPVLNLANSASLSMQFPLDWQLDATLLPGGNFCGGGLLVSVTPDGSPIEDLGSAGTYRVEIFGRGDGGDAAWAFELTTTVDRGQPNPYLQVFWYPGIEDLDSAAMFSGVLGNLSGRPNSVVANLKVDAGDGASMIVPLTAVDDGDCWGGNIGLEAASDFSARVLEAGPPPYELTATITIDGQSLSVGPMVWPDDFPENSNESQRFETS